jgi:hypothetical protein
MSECVQNEKRGAVMTTTYPPTCTRNVSIVYVRGIPPGPVRVTLPRVPPMPYSRVATGKLYCFERMLKISYCDAPLRSRRLHLKDKYMRSCRSTKSEPDSEPDLSSSINGSPILAMLSCVWNESHKLEAREYDSAARMGWWALCASNDFPTLHDLSFCIRDKVRAVGVAAPGRYVLVPQP